jgi:uncharacterized protein (TIRG00374 family)
MVLPTKKRSKNIFSVFFYILAFFLVIFCIRYFSTIDNDIKLFRQVHPIWLLVALATQAGTYFFNALAFRVLLKVYTEKAVFSIRELFEISVVSLFLNQTIPSAGWSGKAFFSKELIKKGVAPEESVSLMFLELMTFYIAMILIICSMFFVSIFYNFPEFFFLIFLFGIFIFSIFGTFMVIASKKKVLAYLFLKINKIGFIRRQLKKYEAMLDGSEVDRSENLLHTIVAKKRLFIQAILCGIGIVVCDSLTIFALFLGFDVQVNFIIVIAGYMLTQIITLIPILPGALLVFEGGMTFFFTHLGIPLEAAATVTLLYRCLSFWLPIPLGFFLLKKIQSPKV